VTFISDEYETEYMHLFTANGYTGQMISCDEGELVWINKTDIPKLDIWEGDKIFFRLLEETDNFFTLKLRYEGSTLIEHIINIY